MQPTRWTRSERAHNAWPCRSYARPVQLAASAATAPRSSSVRTISGEAATDRQGRAFDHGWVRPYVTRQALPKDCSSTRIAKPARIPMPLIVVPGEVERVAVAVAVLQDQSVEEHKRERLLPFLGWRFGFPTIRGRRGRPAEDMACPSGASRSARRLAALSSFLRQVTSVIALTSISGNRSARSSSSATDQLSPMKTAGSKGFAQTSLAVIASVHSVRALTAGAASSRMPQ